jgi:THO complex subunit 2
VLKALKSPWIPDLAARFSDIKALAPEAWEVMTYVRSRGLSALFSIVIRPGFYMTFWQMTMYDLSSCKARYDEEIVKARDLVTLSKSKAATEDQRRNYYRVENIGIMLAKESAAQQKAYQFAKRRLAREKAHWFIKGTSPTVIFIDRTHPTVGSPVADVAKAVIEHCIQPRCLLSPMDADYCAEIIKVIHQEGTPAFYTLRLYDLVRLREGCDWERC